MAEIDLKEQYQLHPVALTYRDPEIEKAYQRRYPTVMIRVLAPITFLMLPFLAVLALLDLTGAYYAGFEAISYAILIATMLGLYGVAKYQGRFLELALIGTLVIFEVVLLRYIHNADDFMRYFPGVLVIVLFTPFSGVKFINGQVATALILALLTVDLWRKGIDLSVLASQLVFLIPGVLITVAGGQTVDRQRRRLFSQVRLLEAERARQETMALHDPLTQLPNRILLRERMVQSVARAKRHHGQFAVLFVDLDDFKAVNDRYGHSVGDRILREIAGNLLGAVRDEDTVARLGGDEFVVLSEHVKDEQEAQRAADRIQFAVGTPIVVDLNAWGDQAQIKMTSSIGIALCPKDGEALDQLIGRADDAMYEAKREGKSTSRFFRKVIGPEPGET